MHAGDPSSTAEEASPRHGRRAWILAFAAAALVALLVLGVAASWHFSDQVLVPDHSGWPEDIQIEAVSRRSVTLERTEETIRPGLYGLTWQGGHAIAGQIVATDADSVTRRLLRADGYLVSGLEVGIDWNVYAGNPRSALGLHFAPVRIRGQLGQMPAWRLPGHGSTWAIFFHGINSSLQTGLRLLPTLHRAGLPSLIVSYRDDLGAPSSPDGLHHMGLTEWQDLEAAARYALAQGARRLVLIGFSMGGSLVTQFMENSALSSRVAALVLDAPALDWKAILEFNAEQMGLPGFLATPVEWAINTRIDADWSSLNALNHPEAFRLPILFFHGSEDDIVPIETSEDFASELPTWVTYFRVPRAGHTQSWNVDPPLYERRVRTFFAKNLGMAPQANRARPARSGSKE